MAHQCSDEEALQITYDLVTGKRKAKTGTELCKMAGVTPKPYASNPVPDSLYQLTRALTRVMPETITSLDQPKRPANRSNGKSNREIIFDKIARGESLIPPGPPAGSTKLEKE
jgi:hypothetical protein